MQALFDLLDKNNMRLVTAESCTGGMIAAAVTALPGSSRVFERGFVTYGNEAKGEMLGVSIETLREFGAVSAPTAEEMTRGALNRSRAHVAVATTGIAGPDGGTPEKPVGTVFIAVEVKGHPARSYEHHFTGDRAAVRQQTVDAAVKHLTTLIKETP
ncbi:MAG: CinA family protein [Alphaproteobacteria bacterium]|nr:CinA family protein [Alphaproteobacteria bacterium]